MCTMYCYNIFSFLSSISSKRNEIQWKKRKLFFFCFIEWNGLIEEMVNCLLHWRISFFKLRSNGLWVFSPVHFSINLIPSNSNYLLLKTNNLPQLVFSLKKRQEGKRDEAELILRNQWSGGRSRRGAQLITHKSNKFNLRKNWKED